MYIWGQLHDQQFWTENLQADPDTVSQHFIPVRAKASTSGTKLRLDYAEAQKIVSEPFPQQAELENREERLKTLTEELNLAAIEAKKNAPKREKTCYFERAKLKRDAMRMAQKPKKSKSKDQVKNKQGLE